jgi:hypothetical protein
MPFNKENFYQEGNSEEYFFPRTNPLANPANAEILKIQTCGDCDVQLVVDIAETMGGTGFEFGSPTSGYNPAFIKIQITDGYGNFVTHVEEGDVTDVVINTTSLLGDDWSVFLQIQVEANALAGCGCGKIFTFSYDKSTGLSIDTVALAAPALSLSEVGGQLGITTLALGSFPDGADIPFQIELHNTGSTVLTVASATPVADVLSATLPTFAGVIYPGQKYTLSAVADGNLGAGAQTGDINFVSDGGSITLTVTWTLTV